ncbi:hypothetical protein AWI29_08710 [Enterobacter hormaechei subsp. xiangfangensis]|uniref:type 4b pilus protein PilO2 n=1 Tax=Enterobacter hormaechei TaxID=158836 RepID=UPI000750697E|nr:type 4b pilus protein PilO2 [Enterobacter hormaechei]KUQ98108.1 hypothetical protein AWI29_08710 [Enterobacter hormaechei subsp. xiangfangensis]
MKDEDYLFTIRDGKSRSRYWLAGMDWAPTERQKFRLPPFQLIKSRSGRTDGIGVHTSTGQFNKRDRGQSVAGSGRLPVRHRRHQLFSLALAFCARTRNGYGIYRLSSTDFVFLASINGVPAVTADKTGSADKMQGLLTLFLSMNEPPPEGWDCLASVENPLDANSLFAGLSARRRQQCRVHVDGLRRQRWLLACTILLLGSGAIAWWQTATPPEEPVLTAEEIQARARAMFASEAKPKVLPHPWAREVTAQALIEDCQRKTDPALHVLGSWKLASGTCSPDGITLLYQIMPGGTVEGFLARSQEVFGVTPVFNLKEGGREARISLPPPDKPLRDEAVPDSSLQLIRILSWFQRQQITLNITDVAMPPVLPGSNGEPPPVQDWQEYAFSFSAPLPAIILFDGLDETGIRLTRLTFELNGSAFSYTTEGKIYASAK